MRRFPKNSVSSLQMAKWKTISTDTLKINYVKYTVSRGWFAAHLPLNVLAHPFSSFKVQDVSVLILILQRGHSTLPSHLVTRKKEISILHRRLSRLYASEIPSFLITRRRRLNNIRQWTDNLIGTCSFIIKNSYDQHYCPYNVCTCTCVYVM